MSYEYHHWHLAGLIPFIAAHPKIWEGIKEILQIKKEVKMVDIGAVVKDVEKGIEIAKTDGPLISKLIADVKVAVAAFQVVADDIKAIEASVITEVKPS